MNRMQIKNACRYADPAGPHMPQIEFVADQEVDVSDALAASLKKNGDAEEVLLIVPETKVFTPEIKESKKSKRGRK